MAILKVKDDKGKIVEIPAIKGDVPIKGKDYFTAEEVQEIINTVVQTINNNGTYQPKITYGTEEPSGGSDGDVYIQIIK